jgi:predicted permease
VFIMLRAIQRSPGSYVTAGLTIAAGIGAVVAMSSIFSAVVLRPMDVERPNELVAVNTTNARVPNVPTAVSWIRFDNSLRYAQSFAHIAAWVFEPANLTVPGSAPERLPALRVSSGFFSVLGVTPMAGRVFTPADDVPNGPDVCVISHDLWVTRFGGAPLVGRTIPLNGRPVEVIGVLPPGLTAPFSANQLFLPRAFESSTTLPENIQSGSSYLTVFGRLARDVTLEHAQAELTGLAGDYARRFAGRTDATNQTTAVPFIETLVANQRQTMQILLAAVGAVLLVACANASTLFLGRLLARQRETAVRQALGASRAQVIRQFLLESLALSSVAGLAGLALGWGLIRAVAAFLGTSLPQAATIGLDGTAVAVTVVVVAVTSVLVGFVPAWYVTRPVTEPLVTFARGESATPSGRRLRAMLVLGEVALSCMLLIGAALLVTSLLRLQAAHPGFEVSGLAAGFITLPQDRYPTGERRTAFATSVVDRLKETRGIRGAAAVFGLPLAGGFSFHQYVIAGRPIPAPSERERAGIRLVTEDYFSVMGIGVKAGRLFTDRDRAGAPLVCIVNESFAKRMFEGNPIGQSVLRGPAANISYEIVGVVADIRSYGLQQNAVDEVFYSLRQLPWPQFAIVARTDADPQSLRRVMESTVASVDPTQPLAGFTSMQQRLDQTQGSERAMTSITLAFAAIALFMALVGLYAVLGQSVASRATEIGVRVALGADRRRIIGLIMQNGMAIVASGIAVGVVAALLGGSYLATQLYSVNPRDPFIFAAVAALFAAVAMLACLLPSWRAARLDPLRALRRV